MLKDTSNDTQHISLCWYIQSLHGLLFRVEFEYHILTSDFPIGWSTQIIKLDSDNNWYHSTKILGEIIANILFELYILIYTKKGLKTMYDFIVVVVSDVRLNLAKPSKNNHIKCGWYFSWIRSFGTLGKLFPEFWLES